MIVIEKTTFRKQSKGGEAAHSPTHPFTLRERIKGWNIFRYDRVVLIQDTPSQYYALPDKTAQGVMT